MVKYSLAFFALLTLLSSCKSSKDLSNVERAKERFIMPELKSTLNVHYKIDKETIQDTFNTVIDSYLAGDMQLQAMGMDVVVTKIEDAELSFSGRKVLTTLPLKIGLNKKTIISNIDASGALLLNFVTDLDLDTTWTVRTNTKLELYEWIEEPRLSLGVFKISLGKLANGIIDKSKAELEKQIDQSINDQLTFKDKVLDLMKYVEKPIRIDSALNSWVTVIPEHIYMSEIRNEAEWTTGNITIQGRTKVTSTEPKNKIPGLKLPSFNWEQRLDDTSHINLVLDIGYDQINKFVSENYEGQTFSSNGKSITVGKSHLGVDGNNLVADVDVTGSFNGKIRLIGKPIFDNQKQMFYVDDVDVKVRTKNVFHKAAAWMVKGKIKNQLAEMMRFSIDDYLEDFQTQIDSQIKQYQRPGELDLIADLRKLKVEKFVLDSDRIHTFATINIYLETVIHEMSIFNGEHRSQMLRN